MKIVRILLIVLVLLTGTAYGKTTFEQRISQLENQLKEVTGKKRVVVLNQLAEMLFLRQPDRAVTFAGQALTLAEEIEDIHGKGQAFIYLANAYRGLGEINKPFNMDGKH